MAKPCRFVCEKQLSQSGMPGQNPIGFRSDLGISHLLDLACLELPTLDGNWSSTLRNGLLKLVPEEIKTLILGRQ